MTWIGLPLSFALALAMVPAGIRGLADAGLVRENYRGRRSPSRSARCWRRRSLVALAPLAFLDDRADVNLLDADLRRWITYLLGVAFLGFLDDALGTAAPSRRRAAGADTRGRFARDGSRPARSRRSGPWPSPPTSSPGAGCSRSTTSPTSCC